jgi:polygalacturonase
VIGSDGIDIVGSRDVLVEGCFLRNNDDCVGD